MNILALGPPMWHGEQGMGVYRSAAGHTVRYLAIDGPADFRFAPDDTIHGVLDRVSRTWRPDLLLCWFPELFPPPRLVEESPIPTVAAVSDWNIYAAQLERNLSRYDMVLTDRQGAQRLHAPGARLRYVFPLYSQRSGVHRLLDTPRDIDILFAGNLNHAIHAERGRCLEKVAALSNPFKVVICHGHFEEQYTRLMNRARIAFNYTVRGEMNLRCFEALACGALLFVEEDNQEVRQYLSDRVEMVLYRPDTLQDLLLHYLGHEEERAAIARAGQARADELALENRWDTLFEILERLKPGARAFCSLPAEDKALAEIMQYASSLVLPQRAVADTALQEALKAFPNRPEFHAAAGCLLFEDLATGMVDDRKDATRRMTEAFQEACNRAPDAVPIWLNLALVCRQGGAAKAEGFFLRHALEASGTQYGGVLLGSVNDPYYADWRRAMALGETSVEHLWADAAARLARWHIEQAQRAAALDAALMSIRWRPGFAMPYRLAATAATQLGQHTLAADLLERGLPFTTFDADYRTDLVQAWNAFNMTQAASHRARESAVLFDACWGREEEAKRFRAEAHGQ